MLLVPVCDPPFAMKGVRLAIVFFFMAAPEMIFFFGFKSIATELRESFS